MTKLYSILLILVTVSLFSQDKKIVPNISTFKTFAEYEQLYTEIAKHPDQYKGYKWITRWVEEQAGRMDGQGKIADLSILQKETEIFNKRKKSSDLKFSNTWAPVGPDFAPEPFDDALIKGTGRINTITFHPTDPNTMWIGGGQGGIWKTTNHGESWTPIGDNLPVMRVSDIAVNPNDPDEMYVSLGDYAYISIALDLDDRNRNLHYGMGVYKTTDGGSTWNPTGLTLDLTLRDGSLTRRVFIHPDNTDRLLAAGVFGIKTSSDAGDTWTTISEAGIWDIERDPSNPEVIYASTGYWHNYPMGEATIIKSTDFGVTWTTLDSGIPSTRQVERIEVAISPSDPNYIYALTCNLNGGFYGLYASTDGGLTWERRSNRPNILDWSEGGGFSGQGTYDLTILIDQNDPEKIYTGGVNTWSSEDGGRTWAGSGYYIGYFGDALHADHHMYKYNPLDEYIYACHDGGVSRTKNIIPGSWDEAGNDPDYEWPTQWETLNNGLANFAFYRIGIGADPENVFAGAQDMGTFYQNNGTWNYLGLGDGMECIVHPLDRNKIISSSQFGNIQFSNNGGRSFRRVRPWGNENAAWTTPFKMDENNPNLIYIPVQNLWISEDGGNVFTKTTNTPSTAPTASFAVSKSDANYMYLAKRIIHSQNQPTEVFGTRDRGQSWTDITSGLPDSLFIKYMDVDDDNPLHVWATCGGYAEGVKVFESYDAGDTWENISLNLPNLPALCIVHHNGTSNDAVYVGMDRGVYYKNNDMSEWELYADGLPNVVVTELEIHEPTEQLFISTFGRGVWRNNLIDQNMTPTNDLAQIQNQIILSPNPNKGSFQISIDALSSFQSKIEIINVMGQTVHSQLVHINTGTNHISIAQKMEAGLYYMRILQGHYAKTISFVVE